MAARGLRFALALAVGMSLMPTESSSAKGGGRVAIEPFKLSAFPYDGMIPEKHRPFLEGPDDARYHTSPRGGQLLVSDTYSDKSTLLAIPNAFNPTKPGAAIILFFHGNNADLDNVRERQGVPRQLFASGLNAVLVAPQLALNAMDSSAGHFWTEGFLQAYMAEAESHLAKLSQHYSRGAFARLPIIVVAYSGGYLATAFSLKYAHAGSRIRGVILFDALFGEPDKFERWIALAHRDAFFLSAYSKASADGNADMQDRLRARGVPFATALPTTLGSGRVVFVSAPDAEHNDFVTQAWTDDPLEKILACLRINGAPAHATCGNSATDSQQPIAQSPPASAPE